MTQPSSIPIDRADDESSPSQDLYAILGFPTRLEQQNQQNQKEPISQQEIRRAYHRLALRWHPDKRPASHDAEETAEAVRKFQWIVLAHEVLSDPERRLCYDRTGTWASSHGDLGDLTDLYKKVTVDDLRQFELGYRDSQEELDDLTKAYEKHKGNLFKMLDDLYFGTINEEQRYQQLLQPLLDSKQLPVYPSWKDLLENKKASIHRSREKRQRFEKEEAEEARQLAEELGMPFLGTDPSTLHDATQDAPSEKKKRKVNKETLSSEQQLVQLIQQRAQSRMTATIEHLEQKYVHASPKNARKNNKKVSAKK